jgi:exosortase/archaeosortase family protein
MTMTLTAAPAGAVPPVALPRVLATPRGRAVLMTLSLVVVYWSALRYTYVGLRSFDPSSPLVFVPFVPFAAFAVGVTRWRGAADEPVALPQRGADVIIGGFFLGAAWLAAYEAPRIYSTETLTWRADLLSLAPFTAGMIVLLYGGRMLFRLRAAVILLTAMSPAMYRPILAPLRTVLDTGTFVLLSALQHVFTWYRAETTSQGDYVTLNGAHPFTVSVTQACAGGGAVLGGLLLAGTVGLVTTGSLRRKLLWGLVTVALAWLGNILRLLVLFVVGYHYDMATMMGRPHDWLGAACLSLSLSLSLLLVRPFGLAFFVRTPHPTPAHCLTRMSRGTIAVATVAALAVMVPSAAATGRFDFLAGRSHSAAPSAQEAISAVPGITPLAPIGWAPAFFGSQARWSRWLIFDATSAGSMPTAVDIVHTADAARFDTYGLAACYGFHGYQLTVQGTTSLPGGRVGESIVYRDRATGAHVTVLAWRQRLATGGFERVVIQRRAAHAVRGDVAAVHAVAVQLLTRVDGGR